MRSAGFVLPGRGSPATALDVAASHGLDLSDHRSALVTPGLATWADLILVMDRTQDRRVRALHGPGRPHVELLGDFDPGPIDTRAIRDPVEQPRDVFVRVYERIEACCESAADAIVGSPA